MDNRKRYFTQKDLEKHINARLMRERKKNCELMELKSTVDSLIENGVLDACSYAEAGERLSALLVGNKEQTEGVGEAETGMDFTCEVSADGGEGVEAAPALTNGPEAGTDDLAQASEMVEEITPEDGTAMYIPVEKEIYGDAMPEESETEDESVQTEVKDRLSELCTIILGLLREKGAKADISDVQEKSADEDFIARRSASSTGFSSRSACDASNVGYELTPTQRDIARRAGISYREYAELLREIPENTKNRRQHI